jgi:hypothetical protein
MGTDFFGGAIGNLSEKGVGQAVIERTNSGLRLALPHRRKLSVSFRDA